MSRSLEGQFFHTNSNNGVTILIDAMTKRNRDKNRKISFELALRHVLVDRDKITSITNGLSILQTPVFTFVHRDRFAKSPWFTGDYVLYDKLLLHIKSRGSRVLVTDSIYVPFSNNMELGAYGEEVMLNELQYVTSEQQFLQVFGIGIEELIRNP